MKHQLEYLDPESTQTLRQGIGELRTAEIAETDAAENVAEDLLDSIEVHDAIHVLFACPTNLAGEISAHLWTLFGTTISIRDMHAVNKHKDHKAVLAEIGHGKLLKKWVRTLPILLVTFVRSRQMNHKWPAADFLAYLDVPLLELRTRYNIILPRPGSDKGDSNGASLRHIRA